MLFEPDSQSLSLTIRQQVDDPMSLEIDHDRTVTLPLSFSPVIHAENLWSDQVRLRRGPDSPQKGVGADIDSGINSYFLSGHSSNSQSEIAIIRVVMPPVISGSPHYSKVIIKSADEP